MTEQQRIALDEMLRSLPLDLGGDVAEQRQLFAHMMESIPLAGDVVTGSGRLGGVPVVTVGIEGVRPRGTILYFHGGAYTIGAAELSAGLASELARRSRTRVVSVEYALAPESPHPAAVEDAVAAYRGLLDSGVPGHDIVLAGESAGGGLAVAAAMAIRAAGMPGPAAIYAASPWVDLTLSGRSAAAKAAADPSVTAEGLMRRARDYAGEADLRDPLISPLFGDLTGLPPLLVQVGGNEVLLDDATRLAAHAAAQDVSVRLEVTPGVPHVFVGFAAMLDEADVALGNAGNFIRAALDTQPG
ncbi:MULTISPECIES: alpha/beta hydrolase [Microbacterium]|uniref:Steryl acetyl hydrolase n=1 Tax=Microbacterium wangchenii TaxID=2541726 RepID=A0ABX5SXU3_9MICO|nr:MULTISPECIES: alpha/beta hydrolase [Microbacterium]MCK6067117.1 alpha/beta hydrolase [Microbacterium sp. EYE_512]QBR89923.1 steryl acetyl hydrolase [Microbacterium wangchenii]TXK16481.1 alpha/beta hydrolase [Microbacterium wangchenii]